MLWILRTLDRCVTWPRPLVKLVEARLTKRRQVVSVVTSAELIVRLDADPAFRNAVAKALTVQDVEALDPLSTEALYELLWQGTPGYVHLDSAGLLLALDEALGVGETYGAWLTSRLI